LDGEEVIDRAEALLARGQAEEAVGLTAAPAARAEAPHAVLATHATALKALGRREEALTFNRRAAARYPNSAVAWHNLASTLGDLGQGEGSREAVERAMALGLDAPQTWAVYARALLAVGDLDRAEEAYAQSLARAPGDVDVAIELANLVWMRRGDMAEAQGKLDSAFHAGGSVAILVVAKARLLEAAGQPDAAAQYLAMAAERLPGEPSILRAAAQAAVEAGSLGNARRLATAALALAPDDPAALNQAAIVELAAGEAGKALEIAKRGLAIDPFNQSLIGWAATAARRAGDPLFQELGDFDRVVGVYDIETPEGWPSLEAYLSDLAASLMRMHPYARHPFHQSLRHGSQTMQALAGSTDPVISAFFAAVDEPIRRHMAWLGAGSDPLRARNRGAYRIQNAWSVLLRPGGFHKDHFHPEGWLSSAFYVATPDAALAGEGRDGWIRFGRPPIPLDPPVTPGLYVRPKPGRLVLFPSSMWHGTEPFWTDELRLTIAFDVAAA
jgi:uncharacterized protein (TIGR02466 family)